VFLFDTVHVSKSLLITAQGLAEHGSQVDVGDWSFHGGLKYFFFFLVLRILLASCALCDA